MSASKEKKIRKDQRTADWIDPKAVQAEKERKDQKRTNIIFAVVAVLFVAIGIFSMTWNSGVMQKNSDAISINGTTYSPSTVQYYFVNSYNNFVNNNYYYLAYYGLTTGVSLKAQECFLLEEGTWHDYFVAQAATSMTNIRALSERAAAAGLTWNDDMQKVYDAQIDSMEAARVSYNELYGTKLDLEGYLKLVFGDLMTLKVYEAESKRLILAQAYADAFVETLNYSDSELEEAYKADKNTYDRVSFQYLRISGAAATTDADGKTITPTDADKAAAMAEAKALAQDLAAKAQKGESFQDLSSANAKAALTSNEAGTYSDSVLMNWLFDAARKDGEIAWLEDAANSTYYVVKFNNRFRYDYNTVNVRHILVELGTGSLTAEDANYGQQQELLKEMAWAEAESIYSTWRSGEATEESFAALANEHSRDTGSNTIGGLYEQVFRGQMVAEFNNWCFDETRQPGDTDVIYSEDTGYHVMYYVGEDEPYWKIQVEETLSDAAYSEWYAQQTEGYECEILDFGMSAVG